MSSPHSGHYDQASEQQQANVSDYGNLVNYNVVSGSRVAFQAPVVRLLESGSHRAGLHQPPVVVHHGVAMGGSGHNSRYVTRAMAQSGRTYADPHYHNVASAYGPA